MIWFAETLAGLLVFNGMWTLSHAGWPMQEVLAVFGWIFPAFVAFEVARYEAKKAKKQANNGDYGD